MRETHPCVSRAHSLDPWEALEHIKKQDPQDRGDPGYLTSSHSHCSLGVSFLVRQTTNSDASVPGLPRDV